MSHLTTFHETEEVQVAVLECLRMQEPDIHRKGIFNLVPGGANTSAFSGIMFTDPETSERYELHI